MGQPAAKQGDRITATDSHIVVPPSGTPAPALFPFNGIITRGLSSDTFIEGLPAATVGSTAMNVPPHLLLPPATFQKPPSNQGKIIIGSMSVLINGKQAARNGDTAMTCNDPSDMPVGKVIATGTVLIGG
jgi:uncharacterized Zn-binding protein involved in type VI secretion